MTITELDTLIHNFVIEFGEAIQEAGGDEAVTAACSALRDALLSYTE